MGAVRLLLLESSQTRSRRRTRSDFPLLKLSRVRKKGGNILQRYHSYPVYAADGPSRSNSSSALLCDSINFARALCSGNSCSLLLPSSSSSSCPTSAFALGTVGFWKARFFGFFGWRTIAEVAITRSSS